MYDEFAKLIHNKRLRPMEWLDQSLIFAGTASTLSFFTPFANPSNTIAAGMSCATTIKAQNPRNIQTNRSLLSSLPVAAHTGVTLPIKTPVHMTNLLIMAKFFTTFSSLNEQEYYDCLVFSTNYEWH